MIFVTRRRRDDNVPAWPLILPVSEATPAEQGVTSGGGANGDASGGGASPSDGGASAGARDGPSAPVQA
jgi:hypothetical protein